MLRTPTKMTRGSSCVLVLLLVIPYSHCSSCLDRNNLKDTAYANGTISKCLDLVNTAFDKQKLPPYLSKGTQQLDVFLDISFRSAPIEFSCCCSKYSNPQTVLELNPVENQPGTAVAMRSSVNKTFTFLKPKPAPDGETDFQNETHTFVMMDSDVALVAFGSSPRPFAHMVVTDIKNGDVSTGREVLPYMGPLPPDDLFHTYYFLLFKQPRAKFVPNLADYSRPCAGFAFGRCSFDMAAFIRDGELEIVGASWTRVLFSNFVRCVYVNRTSNVEGLCADVKGYADPCPHNEAPRPAFQGYLLSSMIVLTITVLLFSH